jgi:hypothetical protein
VRARPARAIVGVIVISLLAGGCVTKSAMMVGSAREVLTGFHEVQQAGRMLQVRDTTKTWFGPSRVLEGSPDRWTIVAFDSLPWLALDRLQTVAPFRQLPLECSVAYTTPEPAPSIPLHGYKLPFKDWYSREAPGYYTPVAAYVDPGSPQALMLVKVVDEQRSVASLGSTTSCSFDRPWAPYARVALVPFAVIADVVTSPFQAVYFLLIGMSH